MAVFSNAIIGIDLGSSNVTICLNGEGVVLQEPNCVLVDAQDDEDMLAVGRDARTMLGRTPGEVSLLYPVADGAVTDEKLVSRTIIAMAEKALGKRRPFDRSRLCVTMSPGTTKVEREALLRALRQLGVRYACIVRTPIAAAVGSELPISEAKGRLLVSIGGSMTEIAVMSMNGIVAFRSMRSGSSAMDDAIVRYIRKEKGLIIGARTAEDLKCDLADCSLDLNSHADMEEVLLRGRDATTGRPNTIKVTARDITRAIQQPLESIVEAIRDALSNTPPELAGDLSETGIQLSGGGSLLTGLPNMIEKVTGLNVHATEDPQNDAALGACYVAEKGELINAFLRSGAVIEC